MRIEQNLQRFIEAHQTHYPTAFAEIMAGKKRSHWMWFIFPQIMGLGLSNTSKYYAIRDLEEAADFLQHPILGSHLIAICTALQQIEGKMAGEIFGSPDNMKLQSSMTLFAALPDADRIFQLVLDKFFSGGKDENTLRIIKVAQERP